MKTLLFGLWLALASRPCLAAAITNGGFEDGTLNGWTAQVVCPGGSVYSLGTVDVVADTVVPYTYGTLRTVHGGSYAAQLYSGMGDVAWADYSSIEQAVVIPALATDLTFWFAALLQGAHNPGEDSYVQVEVLSSGVDVYSAQYDAAGSADAQPGETDPVTYVSYKYLPWRQVTIPLAAYAGQSLVVRLSAHDCEYGGHACWGYIDDLEFAVPPTPTPTVSCTFSATPSATATPTSSASPTATVTPSATASPTFSATGSPTATASASPSVTRTFTGTASPSATPTATQTPRPLSLHLYGNSPNPFGPSGTWITYWLQVDARVDITVYDVSGEKVRSLPSYPGRAGDNETFWDGKNDAGRPVASGVFIYRLAATSARGEQAHDFGKCAALR